MHNDYTQQWQQQMRQAEQRYASRAIVRKTNEQHLLRRQFHRVESPMRIEARTRGLVAETALPPDVLLERIIGGDDLAPIRYLHLAATLARSVGRVRIGGGGFGTGFLVAPGVIMTNWHVLSSDALAQASAIEFDYYERADGQVAPTQVHALEPQRLFVADRDLDFALVGVATVSESGTDLSARTPIRLRAQTGKALIGEPVNIVQHPGGRPQEIAYRNNKITDVVGEFLHYEADTRRGSSGSPVFNMQWELAALHHAGVPERDDQGRILTSTGQVWTPSQHGPDDVSWVANEGVRISSILAHLQQRSANGELSSQVLTTLGLSADGDAQVTPAPAPTPVIPPAPVDAGVVPQSMTKAREDWMPDEELDAMSPEDVAAMLSTLEDEEMALELALERKPAPRTALVAEGDSWFDYFPAGVDIIASLRKFFGYRIYKVAEAGDTLENMAWGTEYNKRTWRRDRPPLEETVEEVRRLQPRAVLLSGGGNDIAGPELGTMLNHASLGRPYFRDNALQYLVHDYFQAAYEHMLQQIWQVDPQVPVLVHGYGYAVPNGVPVIRVLGLRFIGPWLRPAMTAKGWTNIGDRRAIIRDLIDAMNSMLERLAASHAGRVTYLDLRPVIKESDWENELHLRNSAYRRIAGVYDGVISSLPAIP